MKNLNPENMMAEFSDLECQLRKEPAWAKMLWAAGSAAGFFLAREIYNRLK